MTLPTAQPEPPAFAALVAALRDPSAWRAGRGPVECLETHISVLFFVGERVYKVKRPLLLPFLDYSTLERRRFFCQEEVRLNQALAPGVYRRVAPIRRGPDGVLRLDGAGEVVEYAVEMERLPHERMLDRLLEHGQAGEEQMREAARVLAAFHAAAERGPAPAAFGTPAALQRLIEENLAEIRPWVGHGPDAAMPLSEPLWRHLGGALQRFVAEEDPLLRQRCREGFVREGHGDLHAGNLCFRERGLVVYDRIEFSRRLRCVDVACDVGFLAMDLARRDARPLARVLVDEYVHLAADPMLRRLLPFYAAHLATVRGKVAALRAAQHTLPATETGAGRADVLESAHAFALAASFTLPPFLVVLTGLPGSGKSWLARHLCATLEAVHLSSDVLRKRRFGLAPADRAAAGHEEGLYHPDVSLRTYQELAGEAARALQEGRSVVADATFPRKEWRDQFQELAWRACAPAVVVWCEADPAVVRERMRRRAGDPAEVSDADFAVYEKARDRYEPPAEAHGLLRCASPEPAELTTARLLDLLVRELETAGREPSACRAQAFGTAC